MKIHVRHASGINSLTFRAYTHLCPSCVTVIRNVPVSFAPDPSRAYLLSLLRMGEGRTRKSRSGSTSDVTRMGNFSAAMAMTFARISVDGVGSGNVVTLALLYWGVYLERGEQ